MADVYGADRWERAYGPVPPASWVDGLAHACIDDLLRGIEKASRDDSGRLPTLGIFRLWCREFAPGSFAGASRPVPAIEHMASRSREGQRWLAFWWHEGLKRKPPNVTDEDIDRMLDGADIEQMRRQCAEGAERLRRRMGA